MDSKLVKISLNDQVVHGKSDPDLISELLENVRKLDQDLIITCNNNSFVFPFLYLKGRQYSINLKGLSKDASCETRSPIQAN